MSILDILTIILAIFLCIALLIGIASLFIGITYLQVKDAQKGVQTK